LPQISIKIYLVIKYIPINLKLKFRAFKKGFEDMEKELLEIIEHFGINNQQRKLQEEVFELNEAITQKEYPAIAKSKKPNELETFEKERIIEEIADIEVILLQIKELYHIDSNEILKIMKNKIKRTLERIESGYYE
jgi:uncharacterized protein YabN with tetrapyrrole methylase and pyrophosphatase domain